MSAVAERGGSVVIVNGLCVDRGMMSPTHAKVRVEIMGVQDVQWREVSEVEGAGRP